MAWSSLWISWTWLSWSKARIFETGDKAITWSWIRLYVNQWHSIEELVEVPGVLCWEEGLDFLLWTGNTCIFIQGSISRTGLLPMPLSSTLSRDLIISPAIITWNLEASDRKDLVFYFCLLFQKIAGGCKSELINEGWTHPAAPTGNTSPKGHGFCLYFGVILIDLVLNWVIVNVDTICGSYCCCCFSVTSSSSTWKWWCTNHRHRTTIWIWFIL